LLPLPRLVLPTLGPLFSPKRTCRPQSTRSSGSVAPHLIARERRAKDSAMYHHWPTDKDAGGPRWKSQIPAAVPSIAPLSTRSTECLQNTGGSTRAGGLRGVSVWGQAGEAESQPTADPLASSKSSMLH
jgi:hypothetical protein